MPFLLVWKKGDPISVDSFWAFQEKEKNLEPQVKKQGDSRTVTCIKENADKMFSISWN